MRKKIIKLKQKLSLYRENEKLLNKFYYNFHDKEPLEIVKTYKEKHQGEIELMQENDVENAAGGIMPNNPVQAPDKNLNVDGEQKPAIQLNKKKKGCGC